MEKKVMDKYIEEFMKRYEHYKEDAKIRKELFTGNSSYRFTAQTHYEDPDSLEENFRNSVQSVGRNKDAAIRVYKQFLDFLKEKGISVKVNFPPIPVSNSFERLMYIAKYFHDSDKKISKLSEKLWVDNRTIEKDLRKLRGNDKDPLQICGKIFTIPNIDRKKDKLTFASTVHPLFLTLNLTQVIVMLKGLKAMSENPMYKNYARTAAADIWEQLSDYAKKRIHFVLSELLPDDLTWYESLEKSDNNLFYTEYACSVNNDVIGDCLKNNKKFCVEIQEGDESKIYTNCCRCRFELASDNEENITFMSEKGEKTIPFKNILRSAYTPEELL